MTLLVKHEWKLAYVTPLYRFRHTQLKSYSKHLTASIVSEKQQGMAVEVGLDTGFKATLSAVQGIAETNEDAETVFIQVRVNFVFSAFCLHKSKMINNLSCIYTLFDLFQIHSKTAFASDGPKPVWRGWLTCVNGDTEYLRSLPPDFVSLPLFCSSGPESLTALVKSWFERTFDCNFGSLLLNSSTLKWLAALWTGCHTDSNIRYLKLAWSMPSQPALDIAYTLNPQDAWELWNSVRSGDGADERVGVDEVQRFMSGIETHLFRHFKIYLSAGTLMKVSTAIGSAHRDGKIKVGQILPY